MQVIKILAFCTAFALAYSWVLVWILERREKKYGQSMLSFTDAFLAGAVTLLFVFLSTILVFFRWHRYAATYVAALITVLAAFCLYKETVYKLLEEKVRRRRRAEIRLLELHIKKDPSNAALFGRVSELYEKLGKKPQALEAARMAEKLEPTESNRCRLKHLQE